MVDEAKPVVKWTIKIKSSDGETTECALGTLLFWGLCHFGDCAISRRGLREVYSPSRFSRWILSLSKDTLHGSMRHSVPQYC